MYPGVDGQECAPVSMLGFQLCHDVLTPVSVKVRKQSHHVRELSRGCQGLSGGCQGVVKGVGETKMDFLERGKKYGGTL